MTGGAGWTDAAYGELADLVNARAGLVFGANRASEFEGAVRRLAGDPSAVRAYARRAETDERELDRLIAAVSVGETYFFRDPSQFAFVAETVIPSRLRERAGAPLRAWSAGCATGEEAYSLAMLFARLGVAGEVLGTDLSRAALVAARAGTYRPWSFRLPHSAPAEPYLVSAGRGFSVVDEIRPRVTFRDLNLAADSYPSTETGTVDLDLIFCRNVLIYLDARTIAHVAEHLLASLAPGGWLLTAPSDPPLGELAPFETVVDQAGVFYRRAGARTGTAIAGGRPGSTPAPAADRLTPPPARVPAPTRRARPRPKAITATAGQPAADSPRPGARAGGDLSAEQHYQSALRYAEAGDLTRAVEATRRALYLDRSLALGHFTLGSLLRRLGDPAGARHCFANALVRCLELPAGAPLPQGDGVTAGYLADLARRHLSLLEDEAGITL
jgi:chemotaxis protein methyltransferase CheR